MVDSSAETSAIVISLKEISDRKKRRRNAMSLMYFQDSLDSTSKQAQRPNQLFSNQILDSGGTLNDGRL